MGIVRSYEWTFVFFLAYSLICWGAILFPGRLVCLATDWDAMVWTQKPSKACPAVHSVLPTPTKHLPLCLWENEAGVQTSKKAPSSQTGLSESGLPNVISNDDPYQVFYPGWWSTVPHSHCSLRYLQSWFISLSSSELPFSVISCPNSAHPSKPRFTLSPLASIL